MIMWDGSLGALEIGKTNVIPKNNVFNPHQFILWIGSYLQGIWPNGRGKTSQTKKSMYFRTTEDVFGATGGSQKATHLHTFSLPGCCRKVRAWSSV